jgi:glycosyltransferase involved in cell wall biosynthesis
VIIPAYNEEPMIALTLSGVKAQFCEAPLAGLKPQVIVVDDGSEDDTFQQARGEGVTVLRHPTNRGLGAALDTGFKAALQQNATMVITFDADGQHDPGDMSRVLSPILDGAADVVVGSRLLKTQSVPPGRRVILWCANLITWLLFGVWTTDSQSGLRALNRKALERIQIRTHRMEVSSEIISEAGRIGLRIAEVPIKSIYTEYSRKKGQSVWNGFNIIYQLVLRRVR